MKRASWTTTTAGVCAMSLWVGSACGRTTYTEGLDVYGSTIVPHPSSQGDEGYDALAGRADGERQGKFPGLGAGGVSWPDVAAANEDGRPTVMDSAEMPDLAREDEHAQTLTEAMMLPAANPALRFDDQERSPLPITIGVPEPSMLAALALGGLALVGRKRR